MTKTYNVLARKYRPQNFDDLIGQSHIVRTLENSFASGRIAQAWMLTGIRGVGKTTTARILARALNYESNTIHQPTTDFIVEGKHCKSIMTGNHVDVIEMDAASHTSIDNIRDIIEQIRYKPLQARYKIYIIDEIHMLSNQAFNGLLKTLEEPPTHVKFIFATTEIQKVPITILSRCQRFDLRRIDMQVLTKHLRKIVEKENIEAEDDALSLISRAASGSVRDALSILDQAISYGDGRVNTVCVNDMLGFSSSDKIITIYEYIVNGNASKALSLFDDLYKAGSDPIRILDEIANFNHLILQLKIIENWSEIGDMLENERAIGSELAVKLAVATIERFWNILQNGIIESLKFNNPKQSCEMIIVRLCYSAKMPNMNDLAKLMPILLDKSKELSQKIDLPEQIKENIIKQFPNTAITITHQDAKH